jgi:PKD repeat protein
VRTVTINGVVTSEDSTITRINWVWGDDTSGDSLFPATHTYGQDGTYTIMVTAYDDLGRMATQRVIVTVVG